MKNWFNTVNLELKNIIKTIESFPYGNFISYSIQSTGVMTILGAIYLIVINEKITYFAKFGGLIVGLLLYIIGKVLVAITTKENKKRTKITKLFVNWTDSVLWAGIFTIFSFAYFHIVRKSDEGETFLYCFLIFIGTFFLTSIIKYFIAKNDSNYIGLSIYITIIFLPYRLVFIFIKPKHRLFFMVVTISSTLLLAMILLAFQVADIIGVINPFKSFNYSYIVLVIFMMLSSKLVAYLIPRTNLAKNFDNDNEKLVKIFMTWGMIVAMAAFYTFDWKLLMKGVESWNDVDKNNVLWSFTTYRLISGMLEKKFNLIDDKK